MCTSPVSMCFLMPRGNHILLFNAEPESSNQLRTFDDAFPIAKSTQLERVRDAKRGGASGLDFREIKLKCVADGTGLIECEDTTETAAWLAVLLNHGCTSTPKDVAMQSEEAAAGVGVEGGDGDSSLQLHSSSSSSTIRTPGVFLDGDTVVLLTAQVQHEVEERGANVKSAERAAALLEKLGAHMACSEVDGDGDGGGDFRLPDGQDRSGKKDQQIVVGVVKFWDCEDFQGFVAFPPLERRGAGKRLQVKAAWLRLASSDECAAHEEEQASSDEDEAPGSPMRLRGTVGGEQAARI